jgi:two-component system NtrC family sensor kinase
MAIVDPNQMEQVFLNLLNNAFDSVAGRDVPGILEIRTSRIDEGMMQIEFIDNGIGIKDADRARLFEPFFTTKEVGKGTGLGLSVSYGIIKEHDGNLYLDDAHYCGAKFVVTLPLAVNGCAAERPGEQRGLLAWPKAKGRILVVDDEEVVADVIETALSSRGFSVECAANGEEAYRMMDSSEYDLVISDIKMPGSMDGRRLFYEAIERSPDMAERFVFISGDVMEKKTAEFLNACGRAYLLKPFSLNDLQEVIAKTLEQTRH